MNVYKIELRQFNKAGIPYISAVYSATAKDADEAISKARLYAKAEDGFLKSRPIDVIGMTLIAEDVL
jgi:hypothetical protein